MKRGGTKQNGKRYDGVERRELDGVEGEGQDANIDYYDGVERRELGWSRGGELGC